MAQPFVGWQRGSKASGRDLVGRLGNVAASTASRSGAVGNPESALPTRTSVYGMNHPAATDV
jgi:hypothetical protein